MKKADPLRKIPLFSLLVERDRRKIAAEVTEAHYGKGEYIFREGDPANYFHIVKEGAVKCVKSSADGKECTLKVLLPGDLFCCEAAVFDGAPHRRNPEAALEVIKYLGKRLSEAQENAKILALDRAEQRVAALLANLASRAGVRDPDGLHLKVRLTRQDLANMVGVTVETAIRIMARFKRARLVSGTAKHIVIRDLSKLKQLASSHS